MEHRAQTYLGSLQLVAIVAGTIFAGAGAKAMEHTLEDPEMIFFRTPRLLAHYGGVLLIVPLFWIFIPIWGERSFHLWASSKLTVLSGTVILIALISLFGWAATTLLFPPHM